MIQTNQREKLLQLYPILNKLDDELLFNALENARIIKYKAGQQLWTEAEKMQVFPFVINGFGRVYKLSPHGRELHLYNVGPGDSCVIATGSMVNGSTLNARAICVKDYELIAFPLLTFNKLLAKSLVFRDYIMSDLANHLTQLTEMVTAIVFQNLDQRLAAALVEKNNPIRTTHQALADELGSVREIVSRLLKTFADRGWVELQRGQINVLNPQDLIDFADQE